MVLILRCSGTRDSHRFLCPFENAGLDFFFPVIEVRWKFWWQSGIDKLPERFHFLCIEPIRQ